MTVMRNQLALATDTAAAMQTAVDVQVAMRRALTVADTNDLAFLKSVLYRFRDDRTSIRLAVLRRPGKCAKVSGFHALPKTGEPEIHECTSVGGVALAGYFDEAARARGSADAMTTLIRALNQCLSEAPA